MAKRELWVTDLGTLPYDDALALQRDVAARRISGDLAQDVLLLVEHPPVITFGRRVSAEQLTATSAQLAARGVEVRETERGGDITFHGPGQLVGYPVVDLTRHKQDLHWYLRTLEDVQIRALADLGIGAERNLGMTGVWTSGRKIASIGVHARQWVTWHGFALNVTTDLSFFDLVVPCGLDGVEMTSVARELGVAGDEELRIRTRAAVVAATAAALGLAPYAVSVDALMRTASSAQPAAAS